MRLLLAALAFAGVAAAAAGPDSADVQRMLRLLAGVGSEYQEAFDEQGQIVRQTDIDETRLLLAEIRDLTDRTALARDAEFENLLRGLTSVVETQVPPVVVATYAEVIRRYLIQSTGVRGEIVPAERPSLARGRELFRENCTGCHGAAGAGDGPDAARNGVAPANFADLAFIRGETPRDAVNAILLGRQKSGMPAWGEALSAQQVWDLVSYVWSIGRTPAAVATGQRIYGERCAGCHAANGDPTASRATGVERPSRSLSALLERAEHSDDDVFAVITKGVPNTAMASFAPLLSDEERWAVVGFVRTLSLEGAPGAPGEPMEPDRAAELADVRRVLDAAIEAHRRGDPDATALATNAYLRFEPLEKVLAESDQAQVEALENAFLTFRTALRNPATGDPDTIGRQLSADLGGATRLLPSSGLGGATPRHWAGVELALLAGLLLVAVAYVVRSRRFVMTERPSS